MAKETSSLFVPAVVSVPTRWRESAGEASSEMPVVGVYGGTFDNPDWFERSGDTTKHIFLDAAQRGTVIPAHVNTSGSTRPQARVSLSNL
jgi:hypothetical protein